MFVYFIYLYKINDFDITPIDNKYIFCFNCLDLTMNTTNYLIQIPHVFQSNLIIQSKLQTANGSEKGEAYQNVFALNKI